MRPVRAKEEARMHQHLVLSGYRTRDCPRHWECWLQPNEVMAGAVELRNAPVGEDDVVILSSWNLRDIAVDSGDRIVQDLMREVRREADCRRACPEYNRQVDIGQEEATCRRFVL
jgi:hypothetical protein